MKQAPSFPPLLTGHRVSEGKPPAKQARVMLNKGTVGAGDILWSESSSSLRMSLVLEPEVERARCGELLYLIMVAFGDAAGAISAPEVAITYRWPSQILINEASVGSADLIVADCNDEEVPAWMIASLDILIKPQRIEVNPGENPEITSMWEEGCGDISRTELLESVSRHIVNWIHTWSEDGFKPVHDQWKGRTSRSGDLISGIGEGEFIGLDESGNALLKAKSGIVSLDTIETVEKLRAMTAQQS
ncbi:MAG: biotin/lipoate--protein ligase family protein [Rhizobiaceae bacterium]